MKRGTQASALNRVFHVHSASKVHHMGGVEIPVGPPVVNGAEPQVPLPLPHDSLPASLRRAERNNREIEIHCAYYQHVEGLALFAGR